MKQSIIEQINQVKASWNPPTQLDKICGGDMPGDQIKIGEEHILKANLIFKELLEKLPSVLETSNEERVVLCVCGGSGVGKSEIASLLSTYFTEIGIGSYTLSGDNYPYRLPKYNDAERLRIFRESGLQQMIQDGFYTKEHFDFVHRLQQKADDANHLHIPSNPWFASYLEGGIGGLKGYLGTKAEINFEQIEKIISEFKSGEDKIWLKRMGREETELWYENVDFSSVNVLIIEWTHGNSDCFSGVDFPILLNSTPKETLEHRKLRNRDGGTDSPFTMRVLEIEQGMLRAQAHKAKLIVSKQGTLLDYEGYCKQMEEENE
ncbi:MAG: hypothetical protein PWP24_1534 [Clostridiales bacterium]|nr:hypothetical protein [Clostridiales bacterium]